MNAYRNYNTNTSALSKNLEKLSSGYKINRAGDDAAGLAISEKMRAQITGLNAAQKNVKDGISLVKTAEGAMQEIQDMLNRMDYLATQSANGTYDNEVDRANLQKEVDALKSEINRIADSANFNGINLLDGSMDANADLTTKMDFTAGKDLPKVGQTLGVDTVLHKTVADPTNGSKFSVDLHDYEFNNQKGDSMTLTIGNTTIKLLSKDEHKNGTELEKLKGADLANLFTSPDTANYTLTVNGSAYNAGDNITIQGQEFEIEAGEDGRINFTQVNPPADKSQEVDPSMKVSIGGNISAVKAKFSFDTADLDLADGDTFTIGDEKLTIADCADIDELIAGINAQSTKFEAEKDGTKVVLTAKSAGPMEAPTISQRAADDAKNVTPTAGTNGAASSFAITIAEANGKITFKDDSGSTITIQNGTDYSANALEFTVDGISYEMKTNLSGAAANTATITQTGSNGIAGVFVKPGDFRYSVVGGEKNNLATPTYGATAATKGEYKYDISAWEGGELDVFGESVAYDGVSIKTSVQAAIDSGKIKFADFDVSVDADDKLVLTAKLEGAAAQVGYTAPVDGKVIIKNGANPAVKVEQKGSESIQDPVTGDYNVSTTVIDRVTAADKHRLASTYFDLTKDMVTEGSVITIAGEKYTFTTDMDKENAVDISSGDLDTIAKKLTEAAENNHVWTVGHDGTRISLTETLAHDKEYTVDSKGQVKAPADG